MKRLILGLITVLILSVPASADIVLTLKNGNALKWKNYTEENSQYCTMKDYGKICIPKDNVVSIIEAGGKKEISGDEQTIIVMPSRSKEELDKETTQRQAEFKRWKEEKETQEKIEEAKKQETKAMQEKAEEAKKKEAKEAAEKERLIRIEEEKVEAAKRTAEAAERNADAAERNAAATRRNADAAERYNDYIRSLRR